MIAVIVVPEQNPDLHGLDERLPLPLFPLVDRPLLHHIVEYLVGQGLRRFEFVVSHLPESIENSLGDGARWGCQFHYHLYPAGRPYRQVQTIAASLDDPILLGLAASLPQLTASSDAAPVAYVRAGGEWTGWAIFPANSPLLALVDRDPSGELLLGSVRKSTVEAEVAFTGGAAFLQAQRDLMEGRFSGLMIGGREAEPGIWISRNVTLHPTARLEAPVYVGPNCRICRGARIGPGAVIGENCIVDEQSSVVDSLVAPGSYVGQALNLDHAIADRNRLVNVAIGTSVLVSETFLLGSLTGRASRYPIRRLFSALCALFLLVLLAPLAALTYLILAATRKGRFVRRRAVVLPAGDYAGGWREHSYRIFECDFQKPPGSWNHFFCTFWPALLSVVRGDLFLVGVQPRTREEIQALPPDWRSIYLRSKAGLITEAEVVFGPNPAPDDLYTAEAFYSATGSFGRDLKLAWQYAGGLLMSRFGAMQVGARDRTRD